MSYKNIIDIYNRKVGIETSRTFIDKLNTGFFDTYMTGRGLEIGMSGSNNAESVLPTALGIDINFPGYNTRVLPFNNESQDYVYSSHMLEHTPEPKSILQDWYRVLKLNGFMVIVVPHQFLYEKRVNLPSNWNGDHRTFFTPGKLLTLIEESLTPNSYRIRLLEDGDKDYTYDIGPEKHAGGQYEITLVLEKIQLPIWKLQ